MKKITVSLTPKQLYYVTSVLWDEWFQSPDLSSKEMRTISEIIQQFEEAKLKLGNKIVERIEHEDQSK